MSHDKTSATSVESAILSALDTITNFPAKIPEFVAVFSTPTSIKPFIDNDGVARMASIARNAKDSPEVQRWTANILDKYWLPSFSL